MNPEIPDKLYFKIGEVAELTGVKPHVLRYWETEFRVLRPPKSRSKQRLYRQQDIEKILDLKDLLYNQGYTIAGARKRLRNRPAAESAQPPAPVSPAEPPVTGSQLSLLLTPPLDLRLLREIKQDVLNLKKSLDIAP